MECFNSLPVEIFQKVLSYLGPEDLCRCSCVCKRWRSSANYDPLWKHLACLYSVYPEFIKLSKGDVNGLEPVCYWKSVVTAFLGNVRTNWVDQQCKTLDVAKNGAIMDKSACDGRTLIVSYINGYIEIYDLITLKLVQTVEIPVNGREFVWVDTNTKYCILSKSNLVTVFKKSSDEYTFRDIFGVSVDDHTIWGSGEDFILKHYRKAVNCIAYIVDNILWFIDRNRGCVFISEIDSRKILRMKSEKIYEEYKVFENRVFGRRYGEIDVYSARGETLLSLTKPNSVQVNYIDVGKSMIAAVIVLMDERNMWKEVIVWDLQTGVMLHSFSTFEESIVRVSLNRIIVVRFGYRDCSVSAHSPHKKLQLWRQSFQYSANSTVYEAKSSFFPITNRYVLALPDARSYSLLELDSGEPLSGPSSTYINKYNYFYSHVVVSFLCNIDGVFLSIRSYV